MKNIQTQTNTLSNQTLVIVAGAAGEIGTAYIQEILNDGKDVIAVIRNKKLTINSTNLRTMQCSLDDKNDISKKFDSVGLKKYSQIIYLHTIGVDKFTPRNYPNVSKMKTIDPDVYDTNVNSFKYLLRYLASKIESLNKDGMSIQFKVAAITGTSDKYTPFIIEDFCEAKFIIREYMRSYISRFPAWMSGLAINVTSTITESALAVRPFADTTYWFKPVEVVTKSYREFIEISKGYKEIDLIKFSPNYVEGYYEDEDLLYQAWSTETGITA